jgi:hypothetical protein
VGSREDTAALLRPTMADHRAVGVARERPWRPGSQVYVGFFGGPLGVTVIAAMNSWRLLQPRRVQAMIVGIGLLGLVAGFVAAALVPDGVTPRLAVQAAGLVTFLPLYAVQRPAARVYEYHLRHVDPGEEYDSLLGPGAAACVPSAIAQGMLASAVL